MAFEKLTHKSIWDLPAFEKHSFVDPIEDDFKGSDHSYRSGSEYLEYHWNKDGTYSTELKDWNRK